MLPHVVTNPTSSSYKPDNVSNLDNFIALLPKADCTFAANVNGSMYMGLHQYYSDTIQSLFIFNYSNIWHWKKLGESWSGGIK